MVVLLLQIIVVVEMRSVEVAKPNASEKHPIRNCS